MAVTAFATLCLVKFFDNHEVTLFMTGNHHLGDALTIVDDKVFLRQVDEYHTNLTTIVGINGSWRIQHGKTMLQCQSTTWTYLSLIAFWQCDV